MSPWRCKVKRRPIPDAPEEPRLKPGAKDRKHLCKANGWGPHTPEWRAMLDLMIPPNTPQNREIAADQVERRRKYLAEGSPNARYPEWEIEVCAACGKHLRSRAKPIDAGIDGVADAHFAAVERAMERDEAAVPNDEDPVDKT